MESVIDLDPTHCVLRITVAGYVTDDSFRELYYSIGRLAAQGGPYAGITDFSNVTGGSVSSSMVRDLAAADPAIPGGRPRIIVGSRPVVYGYSRMFELCRDSMRGQLQVVRSLKEAYDLLDVRPEDFTQRLFPKNLAA